MKVFVVVCFLSAFAMLHVAHGNFPRKCPVVVCKRECKSGYRVTKEGCGTCECIDPCEHYTCLEGELCVPVDVVCVDFPCYPIRECRDASWNCPVPDCMGECKSGYRVTKEGCGTCECVDPCENYTCPNGEVCVSVSVVCVDYPCYPVRECHGWMISDS